MISSQLAILIVITPLITALIILIAGQLSATSSYYLAVIGSAISFIWALLILITVISDGVIRYRLGSWAPPMGIEYVIDHLSAFMILIISFIALNVIVFSRHSIEVELPGKATPFYSILLLLITGLTGMVATGDLFNLYVFLEVSSLTTYGLIGLGDKRAPLAAFRYLIMGTIGASFYLLGVGYLYLVTGTLNMADIANRLPALYDSKVIFVAFSFLVVGIGVKLALFPAHSWLPDAYTHAPSTVSAFIAATMTKVAAYMLFRILFTVYHSDFSVNLVAMPTVLGWMGVIAMITGSIFAIQQTDIKRMLAYSSIAQIGYIVLGFGLANQWGITGGLLHIANHAVMKGCLFLVAATFIYKAGIRDIKHLKGMHKQAPLAVGALIIAAFSMIGIPPMGGFFSKLYLIIGAAHAKQWIFIAAIILSSLLNTVYFISVIKHIFYGPEDNITIESTADTVTKNQIIPFTMKLPLFLTATSIILLGLLNGVIVRHVIQFIVPANF